MPLLKFAAIRARMQHESEYSTGSTSQLSSLPPTEESFSAGSINSIDSFVYPEVDTFADDENESYDPYLKPLMKERRIRLTNRLKRLPSLKKNSLVKDDDEQHPVTPDTTEYEAISDSTTSMKVTKVQAPKARRFSFHPPSFLEIPAKASTVNNRDDVTFVDIDDEEEEPKALSAVREREYWNKIANARLDSYSIVHVRTAETLLQLGNAHMRCQEYKEALTVFKGATRIFRKIYGGADLSVAMALNKVGYAACQLSKVEPNLRKALEALNQSFTIRYNVLGPSHVDTIDTLNNMAGVYFHLGNLQEALQAYFEVWTMRRVVFGPNHPSVAVTAQELGGVYLRLSQLDEAAKYYFSALDVYRNLRLSEEHPTVARLLSDVDRLGRVKSSLDNE